MKLKALHEAKLAGIRLPDKDEIEHAIAQYLVFGAREALQNIAQDDREQGVEDPTEVKMDTVKDMAMDSAGFQIHEMFPGVIDKIKQL